MTKRLQALRRRPAVWVLLFLELLVVLGALWAALQPAAVYTFSPDQWEFIATQSQIGYD